MNGTTSDSHSVRRRSGVDGPGTGLQRSPAEHVFPAEPSAVSAARELVLSAAPVGMEETQRHDAALVMSELVSNAVEHGSGDAVFVTVRALGSDAVELRVRNESDGHLRAQPWTMPGPGSARGHGLAVVHAVATECTAIEEDGQVLVTAVIGRHTPSPR